MIAGAVVLLVVAAVGAAVAVLSHGGQAASALGSRGTANHATVAAPVTGAAAQPSAAPSPAAPATGSGSAAVTAASGSGREGYGLASPAGWRHGFPSGRGARGRVWGPCRGGPHFGGPWW
jgi:pyruvate/2-oxoglutarate dehydrogenase complex dihydrolipoamide acyltransferase (E2) component